MFLLYMHGKHVVVSKTYTTQKIHVTIYIRNFANKWTMDQKMYASSPTACVKYPKFLSMIYEKVELWMKLKQIDQRIKADCLNAMRVLGNNKRNFEKRLENRFAITNSKCS